MSTNSVDAAKMLFFIDRDEHILRAQTRLKKRNLGKEIEDALTYLAQVSYTAGAIDATVKIVALADQDHGDDIELLDSAKHFVGAVIAIAEEVSLDAKRKGGR